MGKRANNILCNVGSPANAMSISRSDGDAVGDLGMSLADFRL